MRVGVQMPPVKRDLTTPPTANYFPARSYSLSKSVTYKHVHEHSYSLVSASGPGKKWDVYFPLVICGGFYAGVNSMYIFLSKLSDIFMRVFPHRQRRFYYYYLCKYYRCHERYYLYGEISLAEKVKECDWKWGYMSTWTVYFYYNKSHKYYNEFYAQRRPVYTEYYCDVGENAGCSSKSLWAYQKQYYKTNAMYTSVLGWTQAMKYGILYALRSLIGPWTQVLTIYVFVPLGLVGQLINLILLKKMLRTGDEQRGKPGKTMRLLFFADVAVSVILILYCYMEFGIWQYFNPFSSWLTGYSFCEDARVPNGNSFVLLFFYPFVAVKMIIGALMMYERRECYANNVDAYYQKGHDKKNVKLMAICTAVVVATSMLFGIIVIVILQVLYKEVLDHWKPIPPTYYLGYNGILKYIRTDMGQPEMRMVFMIVALQPMIYNGVRLVLAYKKYGRKRRALVRTMAQRRQTEADMATHMGYLQLLVAPVLATLVFYILFILGQLAHKASYIMWYGYGQGWISSSILFKIYYYVNLMKLTDRVAVFLLCIICGALTPLIHLANAAPYRAALVGLIKGSKGVESMKKGDTSKQRAGGTRAN